MTDEPVVCLKKELSEARVKALVVANRMMSLYELH